MTTSSARKTLMTGLIYPAVLGSVLYSAIQILVDPIMDTLTRTAVWQFDNTVALKILVLAVVIAFFSCDYLYIVFTNDYRGWFFVLDCAILVLIYIIWWAIDIKSGPSTRPRVGVVLFSLILFMVAYLVWDVAERKRASGDERTFYGKVIGWEVASIAALGIMYSSWIFGHYSSAAFVSVVSLITICFACLAWRKRIYAPAA